MDVIEDDCAICLERMDPTSAASTRCGHRFHMLCLAEYLRALAEQMLNSAVVEALCPVCRRQLALAPCPEYQIVNVSSTDDPPPPSETVEDEEDRHTSTWRTTFLLMCAKLCVLSTVGGGILAVLFALPNRP